MFKTLIASSMAALSFAQVRQYALCEFNENSNNAGKPSGVKGLIKLFQYDHSSTVFTGKIGNLGNDKYHGMHVHTDAIHGGVGENDCGTTGAHYNPN